MFGILSYLKKKYVTVVHNRKMPEEFHRDIFTYLFKYQDISVYAKEESDDIYGHSTINTCFLRMATTIFTRGFTWLFTVFIGSWII